MPSGYGPGWQGRQCTDTHFADRAVQPLALSTVTFFGVTWSVAACQTSKRRWTREGLYALAAEEPSDEPAISLLTVNGHLKSTYRSVRSLEGTSSSGADPETPLPERVHSPPRRSPARETNTDAVVTVATRLAPAGTLRGTRCGGHWISRRRGARTRRHRSTHVLEAQSSNRPDAALAHACAVVAGAGTQRMTAPVRDTKYASSESAVRAVSGHRLR